MPCSRVIFSFAPRDASETGRGAECAQHILSFFFAVFALLLHASYELRFRFFIRHAIFHFFVSWLKLF